MSAAIGDPFVSAGNQPVRLDDPQTVWFVERGALDVFLVEYRDGEPVSSSRHLLRAAAGRLLFGVGEGSVPLVLVGKGVPGCILHRMRLEALQQQAASDGLAVQVDAWVSEFAAMVARQIWLRPRIDTLLEARETIDAEGGCVLSTRTGRVVWAAAAGAAYLGTEELEPGGTGLIPLTSDSWLTLPGPACVTGVSSQELNEEGHCCRP